MTKQYKGRTATIEIDEKNVIIKSSGFFSSSKKTIPLRDIKNVELSASSFFSKDTVEIYYGSNVEKVQFSNSADAKKAATDITDIARKNRRTSPLGELTGLATSLFGIGVSVASAIKEDQERQRKREIQKAEAEYKKAVDDFLNSGKLTTTTYVNGREFNRPTAKDDVEAVFMQSHPAPQNSHGHRNGRSNTVFKMFLPICNLWLQMDIWKKPFWGKRFRPSQGNSLKQCCPIFR